MRLPLIAVIAALSAASFSCDENSDTKPSATSDGGAGTGSTTSPSTDSLVVKVESGGLEGALNDAKDVRSFLGIPYAKPPVGQLRWKEPQKPDAWTGTRPAKEFGGRCAQLESTVLMNAASDTEDCLYLNVWTPSPAASDKKLPVMFWIHGGGNVNGSANEPVPYLNGGLFYSGEQLAKRGVIVVSINYRLGVLGFLAHSALEAESSKSGNQGLWDQQLALQWVKKNIAAFGGDPAQVTIFGESAGSLDVCLHVASPASRDLFQAAISESGGCTTFQTRKATAEEAAGKLAAALGCESDALACLRDKPVADLLGAAAAAGSFGPNVESDFLPQQPRAAFTAGDINKVPYILGSNTDEGTLFTFGMTTVKDQDSYQAALKARFPTNADQVEAQYPASDYMSEANPYSAAFARALGDSVLVCSTWDAAVRAAAAGAPTWMYNFDIPANIPGLGATHGSELVYVFGTSPNLSDEQNKVSDIMQSYWTNLAKKHNPNADPLLNWPSFSESDDVRVNFSLSPSTVTNFRTDKCKFWQTAYDAQFVP